MRTPSELRDAADEREDVVITHREEDGESLVAIDFGPGASATLDVVGDTAIVVAGDRQFEFEVPSAASELTVNDGMLFIREDSEREA